MQEDLVAEVPSLVTLERTFERTPRFLEGIAEDADIAAGLGTRGFTQAVHTQGWTFYHAARRQTVPVVVTATQAAQAINALDAWDEGAMSLTDAALARDFPAQHGFVRGDLKASTGIGAVVTARTWLERVDALAATPAEDPRHAKNLAAVAALAELGFTVEERERLWKLVHQAETISLPPEALVQARLAAEQAEATRLAALVALYDWFYKWSRVARAVLTKKRQLIKLGLSEG